MNPEEPASDEPEFEHPDERIRCMETVRDDQLGKTAFKAYFTSIDGAYRMDDPTWEECEPEEKAAWIAAAKAVREL